MHQLLPIPDQMRLLMAPAMRASRRQVQQLVDIDGGRLKAAVLEIEQNTMLRRIVAIVGVAGIVKREHYVAEPQIAVAENVAVLSRRLRQCEDLLQAVVEMGTKSGRFVFGCEAWQTMADVGNGLEI